jgi:formylglycine-generating enzyme required for sulfatase activity
VPGGTFKRSYDSAYYTDATHPATVSDFRLDTYEVTVGRFRKFLAGYPMNKPAAGAGKNPNNDMDKGWDPAWNSHLPTDATNFAALLSCDPLATWTAAPAGNETRPMNCISWYEAFAFCIADGGRLPTEAEWNYAGSGGSEQRVFAWSNPPASTTINGTYASYKEGMDCVGDGMPGCSIADLVNVGSKPAGNAKWGHADMTGNVWEWVLDWDAPYVTPCTNCASTSGSYRVIRGGSLDNFPFYGNNSYRGIASMDRSFGVGVRCAKPL